MTKRLEMFVTALKLPLSRPSRFPLLLKLSPECSENTNSKAFITAELKDFSWKLHMKKFKTN